MDGGKIDGKAGNASRDVCGYEMFSGKDLHGGKEEDWRTGSAWLADYLVGWIFYKTLRFFLLHLLSFSFPPCKISRNYPKPDFRLNLLWSGGDS
jgi:hypothetical protein